LSDLRSVIRIRIGSPIASFSLPGSAVTARAAPRAAVSLEPRR
jgi:hypothetical protein